MRFQAVLFDMDGLLIDSELYWIQAEMNFLKKYNIAYTEEHVSKIIGKSLREAVAILKEEHQLQSSVDELLGEKMGHSESIYTYHAQQMPGAEALLRKLKTCDVKTAIASGSAEDRIQMIVDRMGWHDLFNALISVHQVGHKGKPDPAVYLHTAQVLAVPADQCVVLEDSVNGVHAAKAAGMTCIAVPDERWSYGDFSDADLIAQSLADPALFDFIGLV